MREIGGQNFLMKMPPVLSHDRQNISVTKIKLRLAELKWVTTNGAYCIGQLGNFFQGFGSFRHSLSKNKLFLRHALVKFIEELHLCTDYGHPMKPFFIEIQDFCARADKLDR